MPVTPAPPADRAVVRSRIAAPVVVLGAWHLLSWGTRIRNVLTDDTLSTGDKAAQTTVAVLFVLGGLTLVALGLTRLDPARARIVQGLAIAGSLYWWLRVPFIARNDHSGAFIAVHVTLAVITTALSWWAFASVRARVRE
jgi:hypothetical protein